MTHFLKGISLFLLFSALAILAGRVDEYIFVLCLTPLLLGWACAWVLKSALFRGLEPVLPLLCLGMLIGLWFGRWLEAESTYLMNLEMALGSTGSTSQNPFDDFLVAEVGAGGPIGFQELRSITGIRVLGDRGLNWGTWGFALQFLLEAGVLLGSGGMALGSSQGNLDSK